MISIGPLFVQTFLGRRYHTGLAHMKDTRGFNGSLRFGFCEVFSFGTTTYLEGRCHNSTDYLGEVAPSSFNLV